MQAHSNTETPKKYKVGVALSGGGARGFAHVGALKALDEAGIRPDILSGVSAGSAVALLYAAGVHPDDMLKIFRHTGFKKMVDFKLGHGGLFSMDKFVALIMDAIAPAKNLEDLAIPVRISATDLDLAETFVFDKGAIGPRLQASCSIPVIFEPVKIDGHYYVDGGVLQNLPARTIRDECETLIGINVSPMGAFSNGESVLEVALRSYNLMAKANQRADMDVCNIVVETREISHYKVFNLKEIEKVYFAGYVNMRRALRSSGLAPLDNPDQSAS